MVMRWMRLGWVLLALAALAAGCGGTAGPGGGGANGATGGSGSETAPAPDGSSLGTIRVSLVDAPIAGMSAITVDIQSVQIESDDGWLTLGTPQQTYNLLDLTGGIFASLADGTALAPGHYGQLRLVLGSQNTVTLADSSTHALTVPSGQQTGIKMPLDFDMAAGQTADIWIDFDAANSIQLHSTGQSGKYMLRPVVRAYEKTVTGTVTGVLTDVADDSPIPGALVFAETVDESGRPAIVRTVTTESDGSYALDLLPLGERYTIVSMPIVEGAPPLAYDAVAGVPVALSLGTPDATVDLEATESPATGGLSGTLTAAAGDNQSDTVMLMQTFGPGDQLLIVATQVPAVGTSETYAFADLPVGDYTVQSIRTTFATDGSTSTARSAVFGPQAVTAGGSALLNISGLN